MRLILFFFCFSSLVYGFDKQKLIDTTQKIQSLEFKMLEEEKKILALSQEEKISKQNHTQNIQKLVKLICQIRQFQTTPPTFIAFSNMEIQDIVHLGMLFKSLTPDLNKKNFASLECVKKNIQIAYEKKKSLETIQADTVSYQTLVNALNKLLEEKYKAINHALSPQARDEDALFNHLHDLIKTSVRSRSSSSSDSLKIIQPVVGEIHYTEEDIHIKARNGAQVASPINGTIVFAGNFSSTPHHVVVIKEEDFLIMIKGLGSITCQLGENILKGEPIGRMPSPTNKKEVEAYLTVELRKDGIKLNPEPYFQELHF